MGIHLTPGELHEALSDFMDAGLIDKAKYEALVEGLVVATRNMAEAAVEVTGVTLYDVGTDIGGLMASFSAGPNGETSETLANYDTGGEW